MEESQSQDISREMEDLLSSQVEDNSVVDFEQVSQVKSTMTSDVMTRHNRFQKLLAKRASRVGKLNTIVNRTIEEIAKKDSEKDILPVVVRDQKKPEEANPTQLITSTEELGSPRMTQPISQSVSDSIILPELASKEISNAVSAQQAVTQPIVDDWDEENQWEEEKPEPVLYNDFDEALDDADEFAESLRQQQIDELTLKKKEERLARDLEEEEKVLQELEEKMSDKKVKDVTNRKDLLDIALKTQQLSMRYNLEPIMYNKLSISKDELLDEFGFSNGEFKKNSPHSSPSSMAPEVQEQDTDLSEVEIEQKELSKPLKQYADLLKQTSIKGKIILDSDSSEDEMEDKAKVLDIKLKYAKKFKPKVLTVEANLDKKSMFEMCMNKHKQHVKALRQESLSMTHGLFDEKQDDISVEKLLENDLNYKLVQEEKKRKAGTEEKGSLDEEDLEKPEEKQEKQEVEFSGLEDEEENEKENEEESEESEEDNEEESEGSRLHILASVNEDSVETKQVDDQEVVSSDEEDEIKIKVRKNVIESDEESEAEINLEEGNGILTQKLQNMFSKGISQEFEMSLEKPDLDSTNAIEKLRQLDDVVNTLDDQSFSERIGTSETQDDDEVKSLKRLRRKTFVEAIEGEESAGEEADEESEEDDVDEEEQERLRLEEARRLFKAQRDKEAELKKKEKELEKAGLKDVFENEAVESDDEWQGVGGRDLDEDVANSEDERMIDDVTKVTDKQNEDLIKMINNEDLQNDQKLVDKLMDDMKNGRLGKRVAGGYLDIEEDDFDEELMKFHRLRYERQKARLMKDNTELIKNEKTRPFFKTIAEETTTLRFEEVVEQQESEEAPNKKRKLQINEEFIRKTLSFIDDEQDPQDRDHEEVVIEMGMEQLKQNSLYSISPDEAVSEAKVTPTNSVCSLLGRSTGSTVSMVESYRSFRDGMKNQINDSRITGQVTLNNGYKAATDNSASITYLSNKSAVQKRKLTVRR